MIMRRLAGLSLALIVASATAGFCRGDDQAPRVHYFVLHPHFEGTPSPGKPRFIPHTDERAGNPRGLCNHPEASVTSGGIGYYVGGGVCLGHGPGHARYPDEGTWGWDDTGFHSWRRRVILGWSHGRKYQGGTGAYWTEGHVPFDAINAFRAGLINLHSTDEE